MSWMCIARGGHGLVLLLFFDLIRARMFEPFDARWADITKMAAGDQDLEPVLLVDCPRSTARQVRIRRRCHVAGEAHEGKTYLVTVNSSTEVKPPASASRGPSPP